MNPNKSIIEDTTLTWFGELCVAESTEATEAVA